MLREDRQMRLDLDLETHKTQIQRKPFKIVFLLLFLL